MSTACRYVSMCIYGACQGAEEKARERACAYVWACERVREEDKTFAESLGHIARAGQLCHGKASVQNIFSQVGEEKGEWDGAVAVEVDRLDVVTRKRLVLPPPAVGIRSGIPGSLTGQPEVLASRKNSRLV